MNQIKSTLDIIMEKTKGLTLSERERQEIQREELKGKVKGLVQKLDDGILEPSRFKKEFQGLGEKNLSTAKEILHTELICRLDPFQDNTRRLEVLEETVGMDSQPFEEVLSGFREELAREAQRREETLRHRLRERGISGSAVVPNLHGDPEWNQIVDEKKETLRKRLGRMGG